MSVAEISAYGMTSAVHANLCIEIQLMPATQPCVYATTTASMWLCFFRYRFQQICLKKHMQVLYVSKSQKSLAKQSCIRHALGTLCHLLEIKMHLGFNIGSCIVFDLGTGSNLLLTLYDC